MLVPYSVDVPMERWPIANWVLMAVTTLISLAALAGAFPQDRQRDFQLIVDDKGSALLLPSQERAPPLALVPARWTFLQLFSYQLVHADFLHLAGNMLFLFVFGNAINAKLGHVQFVASYLLL